MGLNKQKTNTVYNAVGALTSERPNYYPPYFFTPNFTKMVSNKHHFVKADWNKLAPINTVNHIQFW